MVKWKKTLKSKPDSAPTRRRTNADRVQTDSTAASIEKDRYDEKSRLFSRNRTIFSSASQQGEKSARTTTHQLRRKRRSLGWLFLGSIGVVSVFGLVVYQLTAEVTVSLHGSLDVLNEENQTAYRNTFNDYLAERPLERFRGLMSPEAATKYLQQHGHNEVSAIASINFLAIGKTSVVLEAREPVARWIIDKKLQFVDKRGSTFTKNYYTSPHIKIIDNSGITLGDSQAATSGRFLGFIGKSIGALESQGYPVSEAVIPPSTTRQIQLRVANDVLIKMAIDRSVGEQAEDAARALAHLGAKNQNPGYIDVRVGSKAYYR